MGFFDFGRKKKDKQVKTASRRGSGAGRTRGTRADDLADARDKRKPRGAPSPITNVQKTPTSRAKPTGTDTPKITNNVTNPAINPTVKKSTVGKTALTKMPQVTGLDGRNVKSDGPSGKRKRANVTREQMEKVGLDPNKKSALTKYLNKFDKLGRRPKKSDFSTLLSPVPVVSETKNRIKEKLNPMSGRESKFKGGGGVKKMMGGGMMKTKGMSKGGAMKTKGMSKGGAMKTKGMSRGGAMKDLTGDGQITQKDILKGRGVPGFKGGGMKAKGMAKGGAMKTKGMSKGGAMKTKGYSAGGNIKSKGSSAGGKRSGVRGAGIAQRGVRKAKIV